MKEKTKAVRAAGARLGFSLVEMLVVLGIIATLVGVSVAGYSHMTRKAQQARGRELVSNVATALNVMFQRRGKWPEALRTEASSGAGRLNARAAACLATGSNPLMSLTVNKQGAEGETHYVLAGNDRFGIVSPWAQDVIRRLGLNGGSTGTKIPSGGTIEDHVLYYALDLTGEGFVNATVGGETLKIRANAAVWCAGRDGKLENSYNEGIRKDDIYSWTKGQVER